MAMAYSLVLKLVSTIQKIVKKNRMAIVQAARTAVLCFIWLICLSVIAYTIKLLPTARIRKIATILARTSAKTPSA